MSLKKDTKNYFSVLGERRKQSRVYSKHQSLGIAIADLLEDRSHRALYMRLAKEYDGALLLGVAKDIALRVSIKNKGAYFMKIFSTFKKNLPRKIFPKDKPKPKQLILKFRNKTTKKK